jgi:hypothetical protein
MTITERPGAAALCGDTLTRLATLRLEASHEAEVARYETRLAFAAACYEALLADAARPARAARLRFARAIIEAHERDARAFIAAATGAAAEAVAA